MARLSKELRKEPEYDEWDLLDEPAYEEAQQQEGCPSCGKEMDTLKAGMYTIFKCTVCSWRKRKADNE